MKRKKVSDAYIWAKLQNFKKGFPLKPNRKGDNELFRFRIKIIAKNARRIHSLDDFILRFCEKLDISFFYFSHNFNRTIFISGQKKTCKISQILLNFHKKKNTDDRGQSRMNVVDYGLGPCI